MKLHLSKPLVFLDLETTGTNVASDRIVEIALVKVMPDQSMVSKPDKSAGESRFLVNPEMPIPAVTSAVHGIFDADVASAPTFKELAPKLFKFMHGCDLAGFNSNKFDLPLLAEEFLRAGIDFNLDERNIIDVQVLFHLMEQRTLRAGYKFYTGKTLENAHEALADTLATYEVFVEQVRRYAGEEVYDLQGKHITTFQNDMEVLHRISQRHRPADLMGRMVYNENGEVVFNFGKYKDRSVADVLRNDPGYYGWMMQGDFPLYTKKVLREIKESLHA
jgi:DNA polymerase-3 subunit epsilon